VAVRAAAAGVGVMWFPAWSAPDSPPAGDLRALSRCFPALAYIHVCGWRSAGGLDGAARDDRSAPSGRYRRNRPGFFVPDYDRERQEFYFSEQLKIAREFDLPVLLHIRRAQIRC